MTVGQQFEIKWKADNVPSSSSFIIDIIPEIGVGLSDQIVGNLPYTQRSYTWMVKIPSLGFGVIPQNKFSSLATLTEAQNTSGRYKVIVRAYPIPGTFNSVSDQSDNYFSIVSASSSFKNIEDQTASISDAVSRLLQSFEEFKQSNP